VSVNDPLAAARSFLFVPGDRPDRFAKAAAAGPGSVVIDLEDAVAPDHKETARAAALAHLAGHTALVRINAAGTPWHEDDVAALRGAEGLAGIMLPKAGSAEDLRALRGARGSRDLPAVLALIETARGVRDAAGIAQLPGVGRLAFGSFDFCLDTGITVSTDDERELLLARSALVIASRAAGLPGPVDGVHGALDDDAGLAAATRRAVGLGFTGKLCVHPRQVPVVHAASRPDEAQLHWARGVLEAAEGSAGAAVRVDGQMIDAPRLDQARRLLARGSADEGAPTGRTGRGAAQSARATRRAEDPDAVDSRAPSED
jgi:citrate lyase subunit beta/citryl-CoA lyase